MNEIEIFLRLNDRRERPNIVEENVRKETKLQFQSLTSSDRFKFARLRRLYLRSPLDDSDGILFKLAISNMLTSHPNLTNNRLRWSGSSLTIENKTWHNIIGLGISNWEPRGSEFSDFFERSKEELTKIETQKKSSRFNSHSIVNACIHKEEQLQVILRKLENDLSLKNDHIAVLQDNLSKKKANLTICEENFQDIERQLWDCKHKENSARRSIKKKEKIIRQCKSLKRTNEMQVQSTDVSDIIADLRKEIGEEEKRIGEAHRQIIEFEQQINVTQLKIKKVKSNITIIQSQLQAAIVAHDKIQVELDKYNSLLSSYNKVAGLASNIESQFSEAMSYRPVENTPRHIHKYISSIKAFYSHFNDQDINKAIQDLSKAIEELHNTIELCHFLVKTNVLVIQALLEHLHDNQRDHLLYAFQPIMKVYVKISDIIDLYKEGYFRKALERTGIEQVPNSRSAIRTNYIEAILSKWSASSKTVNRNAMLGWTKQYRESSLLELVLSVTSFAKCFKEDLSQLLSNTRRTQGNIINTIESISKSDFADPERWKRHLSIQQDVLYTQDSLTMLGSDDSSYIIWYLSEDLFDEVLIGLSATVKRLNNGMTLILKDCLEAYKILFEGNNSVESDLIKLKNKVEKYLQSGKALYNQLVIAQRRAKDITGRRDEIFKLLDEYFGHSMNGIVIDFERAREHHKITSDFSKIVSPTEIVPYDNHTSNRAKLLKHVNMSVDSLKYPFRLETGPPALRYDRTTKENIEIWGHTEVLFAWSELTHVLQLTYEYLWEHDKLCLIMDSHDRQDDVLKQLKVLEHRYNRFSDKQHELEKKLRQRWQHWTDFQKQIYTSIYNGGEVLSRGDNLKISVNYGRDIAEWIYQCYKKCETDYKSAIEKYELRKLFDGKLTLNVKTGIMEIDNSQSSSEKADNYLVNASSVLSKVMFQESNEEPIRRPIIPGDENSNITFDRDLGIALISVARQRMKIAIDTKNKLDELKKQIDVFGSGEDHLPTRDFIRIMALEEGFRRRIRLFSVPLDLVIQTNDFIPQTPKIFNLPSDKMWNYIISMMNERDKGLPKDIIVLIFQQEKDERLSVADNSHKLNYLSEEGSLCEVTPRNIDSVKAEKEFAEPASLLVRGKADELFNQKSINDMANYFETAVNSLYNYLSKTYEKALEEYPSSGMSTWYSQRVVYMLGQLLGSPVVPEIARKHCGWVYEGTIIPLNPFLKYFQNRYKEIVKYINRFKSDELITIQNEISKRTEIVSQIKSEEQRAVEEYAIERISSFIDIHRSIILDYPKPQVHFGDFSKSIIKIRSMFYEWQEAVGTFETRREPVDRIHRFLDKVLHDFISLVSVGVCDDLMEDLEKDIRSKVQSQFIKSGVYRFDYDPVLFSRGHKTYYIQYSFPGYDAPDRKCRWKLPLETVSRADWTGMVVVNLKGTQTPYYPLELIEQLLDDAFFNRPEWKPKSDKTKQETIDFDSIRDIFQKSIRTGLKTLQIRLLLDI